MVPETSDLLLEIGVEELPASFVEAALRALPELAKKRFAELRLVHGNVHAYGTPRRLTLIVEKLARRQPDLEEEVTGPPVKAAFKDGAPTKAAEAFATKLGCAIAAASRRPRASTSSARAARPDSPRWRTCPRPSCR